jgi:predicted anti-sigma-YlaC factor YlaD
MTVESLSDREARLARLRAEAAELEAEIDAEKFGQAAGQWARRGYYLTYYATAGFFLGMVGALVSLVFNIAGASVAGKDPLQLIRVYLTFGMGEKALDPAFDNGLALAMGCVLYIATGMLLGIIFQVVLSRYASQAGLAGRLVWATVLAVVVWLVNFYGLIAWLQPLLFGGNWIVSNAELPWWVALATHLVFGWTMAVIYPWGEFRPYHLQTENA